MPMMKSIEIVYMIVELDKQVSEIFQQMALFRLPQDKDLSTRRWWTLK